MTIGTTNFPGAVDTADTLIRLNQDFQTLLLQPIDAGSLSLIVQNATPLPASGLVVIESEFITFSGITDNTITASGRGQFPSIGGYPASPHAAGVAVRHVTMAPHHQVVRDAIIAIEQRIFDMPKLFVPFLLRDDPTVGAGNFSWTDMPASLTQLYGTTGDRFAVRLDLTTMRQVRFSFQVGVAGASGANLRLRYAADFNTYVTLNATITTFGTVTGNYSSGWVDLEAGAKTDVHVQVWGQGGDGVADPRFTYITAEFR